MKIGIQRVIAATKQTLGMLFVNDVRMSGAWTLELPIAQAIPAGEYTASVYHSPHFGHDVFLLENVPGHTGIEVHSGNTVADTKGCILVGRIEDSFDFIYQSRYTLAALLAEVKAGEPITVKIEDCI